MNPALHVAQFTALAWAAHRHNQATWNLIQTCTVNVVEPRVVIWVLVLILILLWISLYFWYRSALYIYSYEDEYWKKRIDQVYKSLKK